jgi:threonine/homoserine/homoserine lactone efflux protein
VLASLLGVTAASTLIVLIPGPDTLVVVRSLVRRGRRNAARTAAGVLCGLSVWVVTAALGLSAVLRASHDGYLGLRIVGACYLAYLGVQSLRGAGRIDPVGASSRAGLLGGGYFAGLTSDLLNPKVGVFFITFLPGFVPHGEPVGLTTLLFGAIFVALTAAYFVVMLCFAGRVTHWLGQVQIRRRLERVTGCVLVGFGVRLITEGGV